MIGGLAWMCMEEYKVDDAIKEDRRICRFEFICLEFG
jgi:hypothetical protein